MFRTERFVKWPMRWYVFEAYARCKRVISRKARRQYKASASYRDDQLWKMIDQQQASADRRALRRILALLEDAGYRPAR